MMGLPFAFASHFAPAYMPQATEIYRERFTPSEQLQTPHLMLGLNVALPIPTKKRNIFAVPRCSRSLICGAACQGSCRLPIKDFDRLMSAADRQMVSEFVRCSAVGCADTVKQQIESFIAQTGADELSWCLRSTTIGRGYARLKLSQTSPGSPQLRSRLQGPAVLNFIARPDNEAQQVITTGRM